jgi:hypothetical protein
VVSPVFPRPGQGGQLLPDPGDSLLRGGLPARRQRLGPQPRAGTGLFLVGIALDAVEGGQSTRFLGHQPLHRAVELENFGSEDGRVGTRIGRLQAVDLGVQPCEFHGKNVSHGYDKK